MDTKDATITEIRVNCRLTFNKNLSEEELSNILENLDYHFSVNGKEIISEDLDWNIDMTKRY